MTVRTVPTTVTVSELAGTVSVTVRTVPTVTRVIPGSAWAQFPCTIKTLQDTNTKIWSEWLPALQGYSLAGEYDIEVYLPPEEGSDDMKVYIGVPLKKD